MNKITAPDGDTKTFSSFADAKAAANLAITTRMQMPPHMGRSICVGGVELEADSDGCVVVPNEFCADLEGHGLTRVPV